jgi:hypothetical protein
MLGADDILRREHDGALQHVLQLAHSQASHIAAGARRRRVHGDRAAMPGREPAQERSNRAECPLPFPEREAAIVTTLAGREVFPDRPD